MPTELEPVTDVVATLFGDADYMNTNLAGSIIFGVFFCIIGLFTVFNVLGGFHDKFRLRQWKQLGSLLVAMFAFFIHFALQYKNMVGYAWFEPNTNRFTEFFTMIAFVFGYGSLSHFFFYLTSTTSSIDESAESESESSDVFAIVGAIVVGAWFAFLAAGSFNNEVVAAIAGPLIFTTLVYIILFFKSITHAWSQYKKVSNDNHTTRRNKVHLRNTLLVAAIGLFVTQVAIGIFWIVGPSLAAVSVDWDISRINMLYLILSSIAAFSCMVTYYFHNIRKSRVNKRLPKAMLSSVSSNASYLDD